MGLNYKIDSFDIAGFEIEYEQYRTKPLDSVCGEARVYKSYPIVYILYNNSKIYIGESSRFLKRVKEHSNIIKREKLKQLLIIYGTLFNASIIKELETALIACFLAEKRKVLNTGVYQKYKEYSNKIESYSDIIIPVWNDLKKMGLVTLNHKDIEMTLLYRYSPFKTLSEQQQMIVDYVCEAIIDKEKPQHKIVVYGEPGTGKSLLTNTIVYNLVNEKGVCAENIAVILPNKTLPKLFRGLYKKLNLNVTVATAAGIINSSKRYDTVVVDEGQRLRKYFSKDGWMFKHLDKDNVENNELQQLKKITNNLVIFYDKYQRIRPSDIDIRTFEKGCKEFYKLKLEQQFRIRGQFKVADGKDYISALKNILQIEAVSYYPTVFKEYDFNIVHSMKALERWVKDKQSIPGAERSRILSGYAFEWISKKDSGKYDFIEGDFKRRWNKNSEKWTEQKNSKDEVGCTHAVLSVDLNYVGVIIGDDIDISEDGKLIPNRDSFYDINGKTIKNEDPDDSQLLEYIKNNYYILLSRGMDGCRVYFTNKKLEAYFKSKMKA